ncbi:MAG: type II secretion system F family protein [Lachnospiraceae bacterium]|nr:type II secretion system F family protein [Lachnospiraceae bacterium]
MKQIWKEEAQDRKFWIQRWLGFIGALILISYLFYRSFYAMAGLSILAIPYSRICKRELMEEKRSRFTLQLRDFLQILSGNLEAGDSIEHAIEHSRDELVRQWGEQSFIVADVDNICRQIKLSGQSSKVLMKWGKLRDDNELNMFLQVFLYGKRSGGNLRNIIFATTSSISNRIETSKEIQTILAAKKFEQGIMSMMPMFILLYVGITNGEYLSVLYKNTVGVIFMTVCLILYLVAVLLGRRLLKIEVD